jgi:pyruvate dehydrogenase E1 component alpha subunit
VLLVASWTDRWSKSRERPPSPTYQEYRTTTDFTGPGVGMGMNRVIGERALSDAGVSAERAVELLADMLRARAFDEKALALQRRGWMSGYPSFRGQEASQIAAAHAMDEADWLFPTYRSNAMQIALEVPMHNLLLFRRGRSEFHDDHGLNVFPQAVPIATQIPHAAGAGMARNYDDADHGVVCYLGDGATSEGDFHEGLNFAGVFDAPVVFFCENNHWAISLPANRQTASATLAQKADAYGFEGVQVDGNDPLATFETVANALQRAREGDPVLVESLTYRQGAHTTSDDPSRYEDRRGDLPEWRTRDPIERYVEYLREAGAINESRFEELREQAEAEVEAAVTDAEDADDADPVDPDDVFEHVYADVPPRLADQREWLRSFTDEHDVSEPDH